MVEEGEAPTLHGETEGAYLHTKYENTEINYLEFYEFSERKGR